jgi:hypothetical protein
VVFKLDILEHRSKDYVFTLSYDEFSESPREFSDFGKMICWHKEYSLGDKHDYETPQDFYEKVSEKENFITPLFLYDHSGITMSTQPFGCPWDSYQVGFFVVSNEQIIQEYGEITAPVLKQLMQRIVDEVKFYDYYLTGQVYSYSIHEKEHVKQSNEIVLHHVHSCHGFIGPHENSGILEDIKDYSEKIAEEVIPKILN